MGQGTKFVISKMPKTGWREPSRVKDDLLQLPKGRPLTPTEEVHEYVPVEDAPRTRHVERAALDDETSPLASARTSRAGHAEDPTDKQGGDMSGETASSSLDGISDGSEDNGDDVEVGPRATEEIAETSSITSGGETAIAPDADDDLADSELLAGEERDSDNEDASTPTPSSPPTSESTGPRPIQARKNRAKLVRQSTELVRPHPTDPSIVVVTYQVTDPTGKLYTQETDVPAVVPAPSNVSRGSGSIIVPDLEASKVPRVKKSWPWTPFPGSSGYEWTRGDREEKETWRINVFFRRLDRDTNAYQDIYVNVNLLSNVDPNNKRFRTSYNKWVLQIARRSDASYTQKIVRVHWSVAERRALYSSINTFCSRFGIHRFGFSDDCKVTTMQLQIMADAVNAVPNFSRTESRGIDAVRGQITSAHNKTQPKNKAIFELLAKGAELRVRMSRGETVPKAERKPRVAIPLSQFPVDLPVTAVAPLTLGSIKRKRTAPVEDTEASSSGLSSLAESEVEGFEDDDTWMASNEELQPRVGGDKNSSDAGEEMVFGDGGELVEAKAVSRPVKKARLA